MKNPLGLIKAELFIYMSIVYEIITAILQKNPEQLEEIL